MMRDVRILGWQRVFDENGEWKIQVRYLRGAIIRAVYAKSPRPCDITAAIDGDVL